MPGADVGPAAGDGHYCRPFGFFHYGVVDRNRLGGRKTIGIPDDEAEGTSSFRDRIDDGLHAARVKLLVLVKQSNRAEHEVAAVPEVTFSDILLSCRKVRFFDEFRNCAHLARHGFARAYVAIFSCRALRLDPEGN